MFLSAWQQARRSSTACLRCHCMYYWRHSAGHMAKTILSSAACHPSLTAGCCLPVRPMQLGRGAVLENWPPACSRATYVGRSMAFCNECEHSVHNHWQGRPPACCYKDTPTVHMMMCCMHCMHHHTCGHANAQLFALEMRLLLLDQCN